MNADLCAIVAGLFAAGCATGPLTALRFVNCDPVWAVPDRAPITAPAVIERGRFETDVEAQLRGPVLDLLAVRARPRAMNVNALGAVPDSSWFTNRIGVRPLSVAELLRGPGDGGPDRSAPFLVREVESTVSGTRLVVEDARRARYILKFDLPRHPELETGPEVVVQRLLWAAGYNVPDNQIVQLRRADLVVAAGAEPSAADVDEALARVAPSGTHGSLRALASKYLEGVPIGGYPMIGVRADDANDRVPHQHRRDVRGQKLFFAWLGQTDVKERNTLDMWVEGAPGSKRGHVVHYLLDFGKALGTWAVDGSHEHDGFAPHFDYGYAFASLASFGLWQRPWEGLVSPRYRGVGRYEAERFDPAEYAPARRYVPFGYTDRFDAYWAATIIARFTPRHLAAAVAQGRYSDPRATRYLTATMLARQRKVLRHAFAAVNPLDDFRVEPEARGFSVCARDLAIAAGVARASATRYLLRAHDYDGTRRHFARALHAAPGGELCAHGLQPSAARADGYTMLVYSTSRDHAVLPSVVVHLARHPVSSELRVIGIERS